MDGWESVSSQLCHKPLKLNSLGLIFSNLQHLNAISLFIGVWRQGALTISRNIHFTTIT